MDRAIQVIGSSSCKGSDLHTLASLIKIQVLNGWLACLIFRLRLSVDPGSRREIVMECAVINYRQLRAFGHGHGRLSKIECTQMHRWDATARRGARRCGCRASARLCECANNDTTDQEAERSC